MTSDCYNGKNSLPDPDQPVGVREKNFISNMQNSKQLFTMWKNSFVMQNLDFV